MSCWEARLNSLAIKKSARFLLAIIILLPKTCTDFVVIIMCGMNSMIRSLCVSLLEDDSYMHIHIRFREQINRCQYDQ